MSRPQLLNEDEINEFLARSESDDGEESDWDNIGEVDEEELLENAKEQKKQSEVKVPKTLKKSLKKKAVTYRQITDIGVDILFGSSSTPEDKAEVNHRPELEDDYMTPENLNSMGRFVQDRLTADVEKQAERRVEEDIKRLDSLILPKDEKKSEIKKSSADSSKPTVTQTKVTKSSMKDFFIPSGTSLRVIKPRMSSQTWEDRIYGRKICQLSSLTASQITELGESEWLTIGVVVRPPDVRRTKGGSGNPYSIWRLSDLDNLDREVSLFLFGSSHHHLWKEAIRGLVVALLRPKLMKTNPEYGRTNMEAVTLTVDKALQALVLGVSKDFGTCNSRTKTGAMCQNIVNKSLCEYCEFHVRNLYRAAGNRRSGFAQAIGAQAKRLAAGPSSTTRKSLLPKVGELRELQRMAGLGPISKISNNTSTSQMNQTGLSSSPGTSRMFKNSGVLSAGLAKSNNFQRRNSEPTIRQISRFESGTSSGAHGGNSAIEMPSRSAGSNNISNVKSKPGTSQVLGNLNNESHRKSPHTTNERTGGQALDSFTSFFKTFEDKRSPLLVGLKPSTPRLSDPAQDMVRARAALVLRQNGGVSAMQESERRRQVLSRIQQNSDPSIPRPAFSSPSPSLPQSRKRNKAAPEIFPIPRPGSKSSAAKENGSNSDGVSGKRQKLLLSLGCSSEEELKKEISRGTRHMGLVDSEEKDKEERHFKALEFREKYEEKLASVREHPVKIVSCSICKYRAEGSKPNQNCLIEHASAVKYGKGMRRYFKCKECGERTTSIEKLPKWECRKCGASSFERTGMLRERKGPKLASETLLVRGVEHGKFLGDD